MLSSLSLAEKKHMKVSRHHAFTLIELLVVIAIIALLASIAIPVYGQAQEKAARIKCLSQARGIYPALKMFAGDHNGSYPSMPDEDSGTTTGGILKDANEAFANLIPTYISSERPFGNNSKWCKGGSGAINGPDDDMSSRNKILQRGENAYAYIEGMSDTSNGNWPIVADGFTAGSTTNPKYTKLEGDYGGVWKGKVAIVVRNDGSAKEERIDPTSMQVIRPGQGKKNLFQEDRDENNPWLIGCKVLNPK
jgi:prepilin-type N-terminal cleavage/methylation domain-containing protein